MVWEEDFIWKKTHFVWETICLSDVLDDPLSPHSLCKKKCTFVVLITSIKLCRNYWNYFDVKHHRVVEGEALVGAPWREGRDPPVRGGGRGLWWGPSSPQQGRKKGRDSLGRWIRDILLVTFISLMIWWYKASVRNTARAVGQKMEEQTFIF